MFPRRGARPALPLDVKYEEVTSVGDGESVDVDAGTRRRRGWSSSSEWWCDSTGSVGDGGGDISRSGERISSTGGGGFGAGCAAACAGSGSGSGSGRLKVPINKIEIVLS